MVHVYDTLTNTFLLLLPRVKIPLNLMTSLKMDPILLILHLILIPPQDMVSILSV